MVIADFPVEDSVFDGIFDDSHLFSGGNAEDGHDLLAGYRGLEVANGIFFVYLLQFLAHQLEILVITPDLGSVFRGDVGFAEGHQVVDIVAGLKEKSAHRRVGHHLFCQNDGTHVKVYHFLNILHFLIEGEFHPAEDAGDHPVSHDVMPMKGPSLSVDEFPGGRFGDIVEKSRPSEPEVLGMGSQLVEHLEGMGKVIFMTYATHRFHPLETHQLRKNHLQQSGFVKKQKTR